MSRVSKITWPKVPAVWQPMQWQAWVRDFQTALQGQFNNIRQDVQIKAEPLELTTATVAQLTTGSPKLYRPVDGRVVFCVDATGGGVPVYARGGAWRRFDTNAVVT